MMKLWFFGWPSDVGGADTRLVHLVRLLHRDYELVMVPNEAWQVTEDARWAAWLAERGVKIVVWEELPERLDGWGVSFCNGWMLDRQRLSTLRRRGLRFAWSNDMMYFFAAELGLVMQGLIDLILYTSAAQRAVLEPRYLGAWTGGASVPVADAEAQCGSVVSPHAPDRVLHWAVTGNYIDPEAYPWRDRWMNQAPDAPLVIGRLSRPDPRKFPDDFPESYEALGVPGARFSVMGWSEQMAGLWPQHQFDERWELIPTAGVPVADFLQRIDYFVYELGPRVQESWGRAVVEAMLTGAVPVIPGGGGHHLEKLVPHGEAGFLCHRREEFGEYVRLLAGDRDLSARMSRRAHEHAKQVLCDAEEHRRWWRQAFSR